MGSHSQSCEYVIIRKKSVLHIKLGPTQVSFLSSLPYVFCEKPFSSRQYCKDVIVYLSLQFYLQEHCTLPVGGIRKCSKDKRTICVAKYTCGRWC